MGYDADGLAAGYSHKKPTTSYANVNQSLVLLTFAPMRETRTHGNACGPGIFSP